ncbi:hypothetical protein SLS55_008652 [Diplodia seriata]|uniref:Uncharacterized protein n=1 Tax=Diplodia seriata TaxID=420778 RepID=A0ABR3C7W7_9PEZI
MKTDPEKHASQAVVEEPESEQFAEQQREGPWIRFMTWTHWYSKDTPSLEKQLVLKLDLMILIFGCLSFFTKYLDQQSITNAYVSGMKEDLHLHGNQLNYITIVFWASYCTSMIPACYFLTRYPVNVVLPTLEVGWGLATFGLAWAQNVDTLHVSRDIFARVFGRWHWYLFVLQWTLMDQNFQPYSTPFSLYLKAKSPAIYSVSRVNTLPTIATALSVLAALCAGAAADRLGGRFWIPLLVVTVPVMVGVALLVAWDVGETGRIAAFVVCGFEGAVSPLTMGWATVTMANDAEERAIVTASMNAVGQAIAAWSQLLQFPAIEAPRFANGFVSVLVTVVAQLLLVPVIALLCARDKRRKYKE